MENPPFSVTLEGASNVRDLGGYRTRDGRAVRRGKLFRSAALAGLTETDLAAMDALGIRVICDLRGVEERQRAPTRLAGPKIVELPIEPTVGAGLRDILATKEATGEALYSVLEKAYVAYALSSNAQYRGLIDQLLDDGVPLLFHCSAGKDRTGFGSALILSALGVPWEDVVADFVATNRLWRRDTVPSADLPETIRESLLAADPHLLQTAFDAIKREYGSFDAYLARALDLTPAARTRLETLLLEPA